MKKLTFFIFALLSTTLYVSCTQSNHALKTGNTPPCVCETDCECKPGCRCHEGAICKCN